MSSAPGQGGMIAPTIPREKLELHGRAHVALAGSLLASSVRVCFRVAAPHPYWRSKVPEPAAECAATHLALATAMLRSFYSALATPVKTQAICRRLLGILSASCFSERLLVVVVRGALCELITITIRRCL